MVVSVQWDNRLPADFGDFDQEKPPEELPADFCGFDRQLPKAGTSMIRSFAPSRRMKAIDDPSGDQAGATSGAEGGKESMVTEGVSQHFAMARGGVYYVFLPSRLAYFDFSTGISKTILTLQKRPALGVALSPDERWLLYSQIDQGGSDLMLVENFR